MKTTPFRWVMIGGLACWLGFVAGCNTTDSTKPKSADDEYVTIEPEIGSRVKKRVKKSELKEYLAMNPSRRAVIKDDTMIVNDDRLTSGEAAQYVAPASSK